MLKIDLETARHFILGKQGLWPGRRWSGVQGTEQAMRAMEYLQLDPLQMIARSQDITLQSRVLDYSPGMWEAAAYQERKFFDWGGWLAARPMDELPHWRVVMRRELENNGRLHAIASEHAEAICEMRAVLLERGTVSNRDFKPETRKRTNSYRGGKDSALALYYLWITGEVMTHHRENFERVYALTETVAPAELVRESSPTEADRFLIKKDVSFLGLSRLNRVSDSYHRGVPFDNGFRQVIEGLLADGELIEVEVEGWKHVHYALGTDAGLLDDLSAGRIPPGWAPLGPTTLEEVTFLAPLDPVSARGRAKALFDFDYVWEVYKPEPLRKYGYYTLPVLWGDRLVARFDSKLERATGSFVVLGFWLQDPALGTNEAFAQALGRGFRRFAAFLGAAKLEAGAVGEPLLRGKMSS